MATRPNLAKKTDHLDAYKIQENYEVETVKVLLQVKHLVRNITTGNVNIIHAKLNKLPIATSVERLQEVVNCIFEEAVSLLLPEDVGNESTNRMQMFAKLCKLCAEIEASDSHSDVKEVITFQRILIKTILSEFDRISKQPSCEEKLLNFLKNVKISDNKKLDRVRTFSVQMEKNENKSALKRIDFVIELYLLEIVDTEVLFIIVKYIITMANFSLTIECLHALLSFISIDLNSLEWGNDTKSEFLSGLLEEMTELLQDNSTPKTTKNMILDLVGLWPNEHVKEFQDDDEIKPKNLLRDVTLKRSENPWRPRRIAVNFLTEEEAEFEELLKNVRGILNKLTSHNFCKLMEKFMVLPINSEHMLIEVVSLIFEKAVDEPSFSKNYAKMCKMCSKLEVTKIVDNNEGKVNFRKLLVTMCQNKFEKNKAAELDAEKWHGDINSCTDPEKRKEKQLAYEEKERTMRMKSVGNVRFIGELFKLGMLTPAVMYRFIEHLLSNPAEESLECLSTLLTTIGKDLEFGNNPNKPQQPPPQFNNYFLRMAELSQKKGNSKVSSRVRFMLQDVIDLRGNKWVPRREDNNSKTIEQINKEAERESMEKAMALN